MTVFTPEFGDAGTDSWPSSASFLTTLDPMRPVPPITTIFMSFLSVFAIRGPGDYLAAVIGMG